MVTWPELTAFTINVKLPGKPDILYSPLLGLRPVAIELDSRLTTSAGDFGLLTLRIGIGAPIVQAGLR
jgi:hypothetical protein